MDIGDYFIEHQDDGLYLGQIIGTHTNTGEEEGFIVKLLYVLGKDEEHRYGRQFYWEKENMAEKIWM